MKKIIKTTYLFYLEDFLREGRRFPSTERMNGENFVPLYTERINKISQFSANLVKSII